MPDCYRQAPHVRRLAVKMRHIDVAGQRRFNRLSFVMFGADYLSRRPAYFLAPMAGGVLEDSVCVPDFLWGLSELEHFRRAFRSVHRSRQKHALKSSRCLAARNER